MQESRFANPLSAAAKKLKQKLQEKDLTPPVSPPPTNGRVALPRPARTALTRLRRTRALVNGRPGPKSSPAGSFSKELVLVVQSFPALAGVQDKLDEIRAHVVNSLAAKCLGSERIAGAWGFSQCGMHADVGAGTASGILATGASGAGKTALVKQIARELSLDPRTLTRAFLASSSLAQSADLESE